jgi:hypothetical protein
MNNITLFQRFKNFVNSKPVGTVYTTDELYRAVGLWESSTWWKRSNNQRMYRTSTYQTYLKRLGALEKIKRGKWRIVAHIPEWFYSKHMNYLLGYSDKKQAEDRSVLEASGCPDGIIDSIYIPSNERHNPFKQEKQAASSNELHFGELKLELVKLYDRCDADSKLELLEKFPDLDSASRYAKEDVYEFGPSYTVTDKQYSGPLMINNWLLPGLQHKALAVSGLYEPVIIKEKNGTFIYFKKSI